MKDLCVRNGQLNVKIEVELEGCSGGIKRKEKVSKKKRLAHSVQGCYKVKECLYLVRSSEPLMPGSEKGTWMFWVHL